VISTAVSPIVPAPTGITPLQLGRLLRNQFQDLADDVGTGLTIGFPELTALAVGIILLDPGVYPLLTSAQMLKTLQDAGFSPGAAQSAVNQLYNLPVTFTVQANLKWQDSGVIVFAKDQVTVRWLSGLWTADPHTSMYTSYGDPNYPDAKPGYTLPGSRVGALIGKVNDQVFLIGESGTVPPALYGHLQLCINDDLNGIYGPGFSDNVGSVTVEITPIMLPRISEGEKPAQA